MTPEELTRLMTDLEVPLTVVHVQPVVNGSTPFIKAKVERNPWQITNIEVWNSSSPYLKVTHSIRATAQNLAIIEQVGAPARTHNHFRAFPGLEAKTALARLSVALRESGKAPLDTGAPIAPIAVRAKEEEKTPKVVEDGAAAGGGFEPPAGDLLSDLLKLIPAEMLDRSGAVFNTGRVAFSGRKPFYLLGLNPGGDPATHPDETVRSHTQEVLAKTQPWAAYRDDSWDGRRPGTAGMQPRVLHLINRLGLAADQVPMSNLIFERTTSQAGLQGRLRLLAEACWPVHEQVIQDLKIRAVLCLGSTTGRWVRAKLGATELADEWEEQNERGWKATIHVGARRIAVVTLPHPARVDWRNPASDPTPLLEGMRRWISDWK